VNLQILKRRVEMLDAVSTGLHPSAVIPHLSEKGRQRNDRLVHIISKLCISLFSQGYTNSVCFHKKRLGSILPYYNTNYITNYYHHYHYNNQKTPMFSSQFQSFLERMPWLSISK
jgi:hypothetical protein